MRPIGTINSETLITIPVNPNHVMQAKNHRYVFMGLVQPKLHGICLANSNRRLYDNFIRAHLKGLYNCVKIYGMDAIDIDEPQITLVSARLKFVITDEDKDIELKVIH